MARVLVVNQGIKFWEYLAKNRNATVREAAKRTLDGNLHTCAPPYPSLGEWPECWEFRP